MKTKAAEASWACKGRDAAHLAEARGVHNRNARTNTRPSLRTPTPASHYRHSPPRLHRSNYSAKYGAAETPGPCRGGGGKPEGEAARVKCLSASALALSCQALRD